MRADSAWTDAHTRSEIRAMIGSEIPERVVESAELVGRWRLAVRHALANSHLVVVASELAFTLGRQPRILAALGLPVDLLDCFPAWREGSNTPFRPGASGLRLAPCGAGVPLGTLRLQLSPMPGTIPYALLLLRDLLAQTDAATQFVVVVEPGADVDALERLADRFSPSTPLGTGPEARARVRFVPLRCISVFAQDNGMAARDSSGRPVLLVPRAFRKDDARAEDELDPDAAARALGLPVRRSRLHWEGGNIVHDGTQCFVGVDTVAENASRLGLTHDEVVSLLQAEFGLPVATLGRVNQAHFDAREGRLSSSGQASFHIDLDVALLGRVGRARRPRALVADAARGLDFVDDVLSRRRLLAGHFLPARDMRRHVRAEYEGSAASRHPLLLEYASTLAANGHHVVGVPDLRIDPKMNVFGRVNLDFGYCNVLPGLRAKRPSVHHFISGVPALDAEAASRMRLAGVEPVPVSTPDVAAALMLLQGGLHCCCGSL